VVEKLVGKWKWEKAIGEQLDCCFAFSAVASATLFNLTNTSSSARQKVK